MGGIVGKNETTGSVVRCVLANNEKSFLTADNGMLGGIAGFNKGSITNSGSDQADTVLNGVDDLENAAALEIINTNVSNAKLAPDASYIRWNASDNQIENKTYSSSGKNVTSGCLQIKMNSNGNLGGITAYNSKDGALDHCVSGKWFLNNKSENDLQYLVNGAFVG